MRLVDSMHTNLFRDVNVKSEREWLLDKQTISVIKIDMNGVCNQTSSLPFNQPLLHWIGMPLSSLHMTYPPWHHHHFYHRTFLFFIVFMNWEIFPFSILSSYFAMMIWVYLILAAKGSYMSYIGLYTEIWWNKLSATVQSVAFLPSVALHLI